MDNLNYKQFVEKLNIYIRKFYTYQLLRGFILFFVCSVLYISVLTLLEYFNYFDPKIKFILIVLTLLFFVIILGYLIIIPISKLLGYSKRISYYNVSDNLLKFYPGIGDKLINIIELANLNKENFSGSLIEASINQKINDLSVFDFNNTISFNSLKKILIFFGAVIFSISALFVAVPDFVTESAVRLVNYQQKFYKPAPFTFNLINDDFEIISGESVIVKVECEGNLLPDFLYINISGNKFLMSRSNNVYTYIIENLNSSVSVYFTDNKYFSEVYKFNVIHRPFLSSFSVEIIPPVYTNIEKRVVINAGDFSVPAGTLIKWKFNTVDTDSLILWFSDNIVINAERIDNSFVISKTILKNTEYNILISNSRLKEENGLLYKVKVLTDLYPEIKAVRIQDSVMFQRFHFKGNINDDYGFTKLNFNIKGEKGDTVINLPFTSFLLNQDFYYSVDFSRYNNLGNSLEYFFSVNDNDFINSFKKSVSETFNFKFPDYKEISEKESSDLKSLDELFKRSSELTKAIQNDFNNFKLKEINSKVSEFEKFQMVKDIMNKKNELDNVLDLIKQQNTDANNFLNSFSENKSEIIEKQQQIDELLKEVFNDELKNLFNEFNELAKQFDSKMFDKLTKDIDLGLDDLSKQLDNNLNLLKKMKIEQKIERIIAELIKLHDRELFAKESIIKNIKIKEFIFGEQKNFELLKELEKDYNSAVELNKELSKPMKIFKFDREFELIKNNYVSLVKEANNENIRKIQVEIDALITSYNELIFAMQQMLKANKSADNKENLDDLKQILKNLIKVSFRQENLFNSLLNTDFNNPKVGEIKLKQKNLQLQIIFVKDSLYALANRTAEITSMITSEMQILERSVNLTLENLEGGNIGTTRMQQQFAITSANNLALFLSEAIENIKKKQKESGEGDCDEPGEDGKGKPGLNSLKESQSSIKEQLQKMIDQMKKGDIGNLSKSIGQTLAQQEMMQQLINELMNSKSVGSGAKEQLKMVDQLLEQTKRDLLNKNITSDLINRQNLILSKLLDAEKSEVERDVEEKRESKTAKEILRTPEGYFELDKNKNIENELIRRNSNKLKNFYELKYNRFFNDLK